MTRPPLLARSPVIALLLAVVVAAVAAGCAKQPLRGYGGEATQSAPAERQDLPPWLNAPETLPEGWGLVDVVCAEGVGKKRNQPDTLYGCLLHARDSGDGVVRLPRGVFLGHVAQFIVKALKYYHVEKHFEQLYGTRIVLAFRPATKQEIDRLEGDEAGRIGLGVAGEAVLTVAAGAPLVPIIAPLAFAFESVREDLHFQRFKKDAARCGLPQPTRRGDEVTAEVYASRYKGYWDAVSGEEDDMDTPVLYVVEECFLQREDGPPLRLVASAGAAF